ncbi:MAG TPA: metal-sulfur cluster assembly factor [Solirubrobacter sp.]|nr:metal-sulfur cluster assembly factor [Solirubrobacter sp.]
MSADDVRAALRDVDDPEYPISIVDMGLVRGVAVEGARAVVKLTYTSMGCPCQDLIKADVRERLLALDGIEEVAVEEVFEEWRRSDISRRGVESLRRLGVA